MSYVTAQQLTDRFGEQELVDLTDRAEPPAGGIDYAVLDAAIADADSLIDGYVGARYTLPLASPPQSLTRVAGDLVRFYLYEDHAPEEIDKRYKAAVDFLRAISRGEVQLGPAGGAAQPQTTNAAQMQSGGRVFGRDDDGFL